jgi:DNA-binding PadR family transcriptional regulator
MTGKEIINEANKQSEGAWAPSPGLIYPLLGRLVRDGLISELDDGGYSIANKGEDILMQYSKMQDQLDRQFELVNKLGISVYTKGKFISGEALERIRTITSTMRNRVSNRSSEVQQNFNEMYEDFLKRELERLQQKKSQVISQE